jgi:hypothetical protein
MSNGGYNRFGLFVNGGLYTGQRFSANQSYEQFGGLWTVSLNAGDYVEARSGIGGDGSLHDSYRGFSGYLLG